MWVEDERKSSYKTLAYMGLVVLGVAFGFSMGSQRMMDRPLPTMYPPAALESFGVLTEAADDARAKGEAGTASELDAAAATHRTRLMAWVASSQAGLQDHETGH